MQGKRIKLEETQRIRDIANIMAAGTGPWTRKMLCEELSKLYPGLSKQELNIEVSGAIQRDRYANNRFKIAKRGWWDLVERG
jgi:hypothetical protein